LKKIIYLCDHCGKEFGDKSHLNLKKIELYDAAQGEIKTDNKTFSKWQIYSKKHVYSGDEKHFCNSQCFKNWIDDAPIKKAKS